MKKTEAAGGKGDLFTGKAKQLNEVAEDANWRIAVNTELKSADQWSEDWGFLVAMQQQSAGKQQQCKVINSFPSVRSAQREAADKGRTDKNIGGEDQQLEGQVDV